MLCCYSLKHAQVLKSMSPAGQLFCKMLDNLRSVTWLTEVVHGCCGEACPCGLSHPNIILDAFSLLPAYLGLYGLNQSDVLALPVFQIRALCAKTSETMY